MLFMIGKKIKEERKKRKMTQAQLASINGMSRTTISLIENGVVVDVGVRKLIRIMETLDLELVVRKAGASPTLEEIREGFFDEA